MDELTFKNLALAIAREEGKKKQVNIAQIREILSITLRLLHEHGEDRKAAGHLNDTSVLEFIHKHGAT